MKKIFSFFNDYLKEARSSKTALNDKILFMKSYLKCRFIEVIKSFKLFAITAF